MAFAAVRRLLNTDCSKLFGDRRLRRLKLDSAGFFLTSFPASPPQPLFLPRSRYLGVLRIPRPEIINHSTLGVTISVLAYTFISFCSDMSEIPNPPKVYRDNCVGDNARVLYGDHHGDVIHSNASPDQVVASSTKK